jgi:20S proteasome alpha/beta subunit
LFTEIIFEFVGKGAVYGYDAVGSFKRDEYGAMGSGQNFVIPILDNLVGHKNRNDPKKPLSLQDAVSIVKDVFVIATERDIYTGIVLLKLFVDYQTFIVTTVLKSR